MEKINNLYIFGWPSFLGGADTKLTDLLELLYKDYIITVIPNWEHQLKEQHWTSFMEERQIKYCLEEELDYKLTGIAIAFCNNYFFTDERHRRAIARGLKVIWSSEMMWKHGGEIEALNYKEIDRVLLVSEIQKNKLNYENVDTFITGNWVNPDNWAKFPKQEPSNTFTIGRVSRADPSKYPENFPNLMLSFIEGIENSKIRVMGWSDQLTNKWPWFKPNPNKFELLSQCAEPTSYFYNSLDVFVYPLGHTFTESWGRTVVEAQLCGLPVICDAGHHMDNTIINMKTGILCKTWEEYIANIRGMAANPSIMELMSANAIMHANKLMDRETHLNIWKEALDV